MSDIPQIQRQAPRSKENFYETFKDLLSLTPANLDAKYQFYLTHPLNIKNAFTKATKW